LTLFWQPPASGLQQWQNIGGLFSVIIQTVFILYSLVKLFMSLLVPPSGRPSSCRTSGLLSKLSAKRRVGSRYTGCPVKSRPTSFKYKKKMWSQNFQKFNFEIPARALPVINIHIYRCTYHTAWEKKINVKKKIAVWIYVINFFLQFFFFNFF
jgi:hypothetical protein